MIEVRGVGIIRLKHQECIHRAVKLDKVIILTDKSKIERLPEKEVFELDDLKLPLLRLYPFEESAIMKLKYWLSI